MSERPGAGFRRHLIALAVLAAAVGCVYGDALDGDFVLDNRVLVLENPVIQRATLANVGFILTHDYWQPMATDGLYRPFVILSFMLNYAVLGNGSRPFGYHALNVLLHLACVGAVYALVWHLTRRRWPALVAAMLFAVHPVATEAVTNIVGRADLLATLGALAALVCLIRAGAAAGWRRGAWRGGLAAAATLAFFSKESGLALVPIALAWDGIIRPPGSLPRRFRREHVVTLSVLTVYLAARWYVAHTGLPAAETSPVDNPLVEAGFWTGRLTAVGVLGRELALLVWPRVLSADYSYAQIPVVAWPPLARQDWAAVVMLVVLASAAVATLRVRRSQPALCFLASFAALALLPSANLVTLTGSIMAERFLYLPLAGLAGAAALIAERVAWSDTSPTHSARRIAVVSGGIAVAVLACGARARARNADWRDELHLWSSAVQASPASAKAHKAYAAALLAADPEQRQLDRVTAEGEQAVAIRPDYLGALIDLGSYYLLQGDRAATSGGDAAGWYERSVRVLEQARLLQAGVDHRFVERILARGVAPDSVPYMGNALLLGNLSLAYVRAQRYADALEVYEEWRRFEPGRVQRYVDISAVLCNLGRWEDASIALFQATILDAGNDDATRRLAEVYRTFYPQGGAVIVDARNHVQINLDEPVVRRHRCRAYIGLGAIFTEARMKDEAARVRTTGTAVCGPDGAG